MLEFGKCTACGSEKIEIAHPVKGQVHIECRECGNITDVWSVSYGGRDAGKPVVAETVSAAPKAADDAAEMSAHDDARIEEGDLNDEDDEEDDETGDEEDRDDDEDDEEDDEVYRDE